MSALSNIKNRQRKNLFFKATIIVMASICAIPLALVLFYIIKQGLAALSWNFITKLPTPIGVPGGGILNAIVGTLMLISIATIIAVPIGIICGIYISENRNKKFAGLVRLCAEILQGIPSIVIGIITYLWVVKPFGGFSAFSGGIALAIMMLPVVVRTTEETLNLVPNSLKEASLALGVSYSKTLRKVIVPCALSGIASGVTLSIARIAGETAPLLFTAFGNPYLNLDITKPVDSLPMLIYTRAISPYEEWHQQAWGAALVLIILIFSISLLSKLIIKKWKVQF
ncbi:MAG TPA: phosphate ABC transporter permease PstA [Edaphocola sp.]|nr:phosphate ABC transporter permease PstA [Edaphocola sp.]